MNLASEEITGPALEILHQGDASEMIPLDRPEFLIGRNPDCNLFLNDPSISHCHCRLLQKEGTSWIEDLTSGAGTHLNDRKIEASTRLHEGDQIRVGNVILVFYPPRGHSDPTLIGPGSYSQKSGSLKKKIIPVRDRIIFGRQKDCDVVLPGPGISRRHGEVRREGNSLRVVDFDSSNGTFIDGVRVEGLQLLADGNRLRIGSFVFLVKSGALHEQNEHHNVRLSAHHLSKGVRDRSTGKEIYLLRDISLTVQPGEFVAILGASGSGKSTFMDALNGRRPASSGLVCINGNSLYAQYEYYKTAIGYVPQKDIVSPGLSLEKALYFTAKLRLPDDTSSAEIRKRIDEVIFQVGLLERKNVRIGDLSGGQIKRVSLAVELVSSPTLIFLDEVTSGLDAGTERQMMALFRDLCHAGKTIIGTTHNLMNIDMCDKIAVLSRGRLVYYGPPGEAAGFFAVDDLSDLYSKVEMSPAEAWEKDFRHSNQYEQYVRNGSGKMHPKGSTPPIGLNRRSFPKTGNAFRQLGILVRRYFLLTLLDRRNTMLLLLQAPAIALLIGLVFQGKISGETVERASMVKMVHFLLVISAIWFGCINAAKEIVKELPAYLRERAFNLSPGSYLLSKVIVLGAISGLQVSALLFIVGLLTGLPGNTGMQWVTLCLASLNGMAIGLAISALVSSNDRAISLVPLALIPQVILAGTIVSLPGAIKIFASGFISSYWAVDGLKNTLPEELENAATLPGQQIFAETSSLGVDLGMLMILPFLFLVLAWWGLVRKDRA